MSLQDESFPADDLFDYLNATTDSTTRSLQRQYSLRQEHPETENFEENESPFLNSGCSEETCASDPVSLEREHENGNDKNVSGTKAKSYQDIHSAYTKRRYKHVTSKVKKYIAEMDKGKNKQHQRNGGGVASTSSFQRHRSMPESLTPRGNADEEDARELMLNDVSNNDEESSGTRDESYERLHNKIDSQQRRIEYLESDIFKKTEYIILLRKNFDAVRDDFTDYKEKIKRQTANQMGHSLHSLMYYPTKSAMSEIPKVPKATQTDLMELGTIHMSCHLSDLSDMPAIAANATPHPNANLNDITYDSSAGSIEIPLLSARPAVRHLEPERANNMNPLSLDFSNDSAEVDANGNAITNTAAGTAPSSSNRITTNNSGSSHPSSNDSAIDIENHELRSPQPRYRGQTISFGPMPGDWQQRQDIIYFDKRSNRVIQLVQLNPAPANDSNNNNNSSSSNNNNSSIQSESFALMQYPANQNRRKRTLATRLMRLFGPCARCDDPNQTMDATNATYTVGIPLLAHESDRH